MLPTYGLPDGTGLFVKDGAIKGTGVTEEDADDADDGPFALFALTVKVYGVEFARPVSVIGDDEPVAVVPSLAVTV